MFPILKIRLIYVRRNLCKNLFQLFYPIFYILLVGYSINSLTSKIAKIKENEPLTYGSDSFDLNNYEDINNINDEFGIICENKEILDKFIEFTGKIYSVSRLQIKAFSSEKEYKNYIYSLDYVNATPFDFIVEIKGNEPKNLNFYIKSKTLKIRSIYSSSNVLTFKRDYMNLEINDVQKWYNYDILLYNFMLYLNKIEEQKNNITINFKPIKTPPLFNPLGEESVMLVPMLISISYSSTLFTFFLWMVKEKERKLKDLLARQGINPIRYFLSWILTFITLTIIPMTLCAYIIKKFFFHNISFYWIFFFLVFIYNKYF